MVACAAALAAFLASFGVLGSDAMWMVPLGGQVAHGHLPGSIAYATAASNSWHDVPALGQLVFWAAYHLFGGVRGLVVLQVAAVAIAFGALARGIGDKPAVLALVLLGALPAVAVTNAGLFSLALFAVLLLVLESEASLWWCVPLLALWGNLHGGVLAGWALLACFVVLERRRAWPVLVAATLALGLNPTLWHTPSYYAGVFSSEVARSGDGLWAPLGFAPLDLVLIASVLVLGALSVRHARLWEAVALLGLAAATVHVARNGVALVFLAAYPAARAFGSRRLPVGPAVILAAAVVAAVVRGPVATGSPSLARQAAETGRPVLAEPILGQQVVLAGGTVWIENPIDAFRRSDQRLYLDWLSSRGDAAVERAGYVLVEPWSKAGRRAAADERLTRVAGTKAAVLYRVMSP